MSVNSLKEGALFFEFALSALGCVLSKQLSLAVSILMEPTV